MRCFTSPVVSLRFSRTWSRYLPTPCNVLAISDEASAQEAVKAAEKALNEKGADFDYSAAAVRLAEAAAQLRTLPADPQEVSGYAVMLCAID